MKKIGTRGHAHRYLGQHTRTTVGKCKERTVSWMVAARIDRGSMPGSRKLRGAGAGSVGVTETEGPARPGRNNCNINGADKKGRSGKRRRQKDTVVRNEYIKDGGDKRKRYVTWRGSSGKRTTDHMAGIKDGDQFALYELEGKKIKARSAVGV